MPISPFYNAVPNLVHTNQWDFDIPTDSGNIEPLKYLIRSANLPFWKLKTEMTEGSGRKYYTGIDKAMDFSLEFTETANFDCYNYFTAWQAGIYDKATMLFKKNPIRRTIIVTFIEMSENNPRKALMTYKLINAIVKDLDDYSLSYDSGEPLITKVNLSCDQIISVKGA